VNDGSTANDLYATAAGNDLNTGLSPVAPKASLKAILDAYNLEPGALILIDTGYYPMSAPAILEPEDQGSLATLVTIRGSTHADGSTLDLQGAAADVIRCKGSHVLVEHLRLTGAASGAGFSPNNQSNAGDAQHTTLRRCRIYANKYGVWLNSGPVNTRVQNCLLFHNTTAGIYASTAGAAAEDTVLLNNTVVAPEADAQGWGTITDNDPPPTISITDKSVLEGNSGQADALFTVRLSTASGKVITVRYVTADDTATTADNDYKAVAGVLTFNPGETSKTLAVPILGDRQVELDETFFVNLTDLVNLSRTNNDTQGVGQIRNEDIPQVTVTLTKPAPRTIFSRSEPIPLEATAASQAGPISRVEFYAGSLLLGEDRTSPFTLAWLADFDGDYYLKARAYDAQGNQGESEEVPIAVSSVCGSVAIRRRTHTEEIAKLADYLYELGVKSEVFPTDGLTAARLADFEVFKVALWVDVDGQGLHDGLVDLLQKLAERGTALGFFGDTLLSSADRLSPDRRATWTGLIHLQQGGAAGPAGVVRIETTADPLPLEIVSVGTKVGAILDFNYTSLGQAGQQTGLLGETVLGRHGTAHVLVAYADPGTADAFRRFTHMLRVWSGTDAASLEQRKKLFQNAVWWLLNCQDCSTLDMVAEDHASPATAVAGSTVTYRLKVVRSGECEGIEVVAFLQLPANLVFKAAASERGHWAYANGVVTFYLGRMATTLEELEVTAQAVQPGAATATFTVRALNESALGLENNSVRIETQITAAP
jgi:hypothetical protein